MHKTSYVVHLKILEVGLNCLFRFRINSNIMNIFYVFGWKFRWETCQQNNLHVRKITQLKPTRKYSSASGGIQTGVHNATADQLFKENLLKNN